MPDKRMHNGKPQKLIVHCGYHKAGTQWIRGVLRDLAQEFGWKIHYGSQDELEEDTLIFFQDHSRVDCSRLPPYVGSHIIRDPRDVVISGYFFHLWCKEKWCRKKKYWFWGPSYQRTLNALSRNKGISHEIRTIGRKTIQSMLRWDYKNPNIMELRYEDLVSDEKAVFTRLFQWYGLSEQDIPTALKVVEAHNFSMKTNRPRGVEDRTKHRRKGVPGDWKNHFTEEHKQLFKELFPGALARLGYEQDDRW